MLNHKGNMNLKSLDWQCIFSGNVYFLSQGKNYQSVLTSSTDTQVFDS